MEERGGSGWGHLKVDLDDLAMALECHDPDALQGVDLETGEVLILGPDAREEDPEAPWEDPDRFMGIEPLDSREGFAILEDFAQALPAGEARRALERALGMRHPFRAFKDTLLDFPGVREAWFRFHDTRMRTLALEWVQDHLPGAGTVPS